MSMRCAFDLVEQARLAAAVGSDDGDSVGGNLRMSPDLLLQCRILGALPGKPLPETFAPGRERRALDLDGVAVQCDDVVATGVEKRAIMGNQQEARLGTQVVGRLAPAVGVQVVGRLVDQGKAATRRVTWESCCTSIPAARVRIRHEQAGKKTTRLFATREIRERPVPGSLVDPKRGELRFDAAVDGVAAGLLVVVEEFTVAGNGILATIREQAIHLGLPSAEGADGILDDVSDALLGIDDRTWEVGGRYLLDPAAVRDEFA